MPWSSLPEPMLARSGRLSTRSGYAFEVKWDGFRAIVRTAGEFRVRSRRGWNMTLLVPELAELPARGTFDGELVAFGSRTSEFRKGLRAERVGAASGWERWSVLIADRLDDPEG